MSAIQSQDFSVRGYMFLTSVEYLQQTLGEQDSKKVISGFSPHARELIGTLKTAGWCPVSVFSEVTDALVAAGAGSDERSKDLLVKCGTHMALEATNTFLRLFMKMMSMQLLVKKVPDLWKRDCTGGKLVVEDLSENSLRFSTSGMGGFRHAVCTAAGFVSFAVGAVGKQVEKVTIQGWSREKPSEDGATFELTWRG